MSKFKPGHQCFLRVKRKTLAAEIRNIKKEIKKALPGSILQAELQSHLDSVVRREYRAASYANAFLKGVPIDMVETDSKFLRYVKSLTTAGTGQHDYDDMEILRLLKNNIAKFGCRDFTFYPCGESPLDVWLKTFSKTEEKQGV